MKFILAAYIMLCAFVSVKNVGPVKCLTTPITIEWLLTCMNA